MRFRESARALILDPQDHVLLVHFQWEGLEIPDGFWATPGGGIESGETRLQAIQRELLEETGLSIETLGPEVWTKTAAFPMAQWDGQIDHTHFYRVERFEPTPALSRAELAAENIHEVRWWSPDELSNPGMTFAPRSLPDLLDRLRREGVGSSPVRLTGF
ncbi:MAG TPA: NUDIX domain-containing protein [Nocardioidaceae bacterium]|nr:NUDIX domain-containing protein [Nocardioidaceae bacterium]